MNAFTQKNIDTAGRRLYLVWLELAAATDKFQRESQLGLPSEKAMSDLTAAQIEFNYGMSYEMALLSTADPHGYIQSAVGAAIVAHHIERATRPARTRAKGEPMQTTQPKPITK